MAASAPKWRAELPTATNDEDSDDGDGRQNRGLLLCGVYERKRDAEEIEAAESGQRKRKRRDLPTLPGARKRGSKKKAIKTLRDPEKRRKARKALEADFCAASGAASISSKRVTV